METSGLGCKFNQKRMTNEIKLTIWLASRGAPVPAIWDVDLEESTIIMEKIDGKPLIEILRANQHDEELLIKPVKRFVSCIEMR